MSTKAMLTPDELKHCQSVLAQYFRDKKPEPVDMRFVHRSYRLSELVLGMRRIEREPKA